MKSLSIVIFALLFVYGCARKNVPAAPVNTADTMKEPDAIKMPATDLKNSAEAIAGMGTYNSKCGKCHGLKNTADYTKEQWIPIMGRMAIKAHLDTMEKANVIVYVQSHAKNS